MHALPNLARAAVLLSTLPVIRRSYYHCMGKVQRAFLGLLEIQDVKSPFTVGESFVVSRSHLAQSFFCLSVPELYDSTMVLVFRTIPLRLFRVNNGPTTKLRAFDARPSRRSFDLLTVKGRAVPRALMPKTYKGGQQRYPVPSSRSLTNV